VNDATKAAELAEKFHNLYEQLAPEHGYETRKESAVPWEKVPERNKSLMIDVCGHLLAELTARAETAEREAALWRPLTPAEAEKALDEAEAVPMTDDEIAAIVKRATDPADWLSNSEQAQLAIRLGTVERERDRLRAACEASDRYFRAVAAAWTVNKGRIVTPNDTLIIEAEGLDELCDHAAELTIAALAPEAPK